jgi:TRAP-type C4-dicarboxylate transport system permease small subunit
MLRERIKKINHFFAELSGWLLSAIMFLLIIDFVSRGMYRPIQGVGELAVFVMVSVVYLGIPHAEQVRGHVRVTAITNRLPQTVRNWMNLIVYVLCTGIIGFVVFAVTQNAIKSYTSDEAVAGTVPLPVWPVKTVIVIGCTFYFIQIVLNTIDEIKKLTSSPSPPIDEEAQKGDKGA